jgi:hypothetical protein
MKYFQTQYHRKVQSAHFTRGHPRFKEFFPKFDPSLIENTGTCRKILFPCKNKLQTITTIL